MGNKKFSLGLLTNRHYTSWGVKQNRRLAAATLCRALSETDYGYVVPDVDLFHQVYDSGAVRLKLLPGEEDPARKPIRRPTSACDPRPERHVLRRATNGRNKP